MPPESLEIEFFSGTDPLLSEALAVRQEVFIEEQGIDPLIELDDYDYIAWHILAREGGRAIATARLVTLDATTAKIGRVAVLKQYRERGLASQLLAMLIEYCVREGFSKVVLDAQLSALRLYEKQGFQAVGPVFLEAEIPHQRMEKTLK
ncbi:MAG TPA: N-acetyltransferase [Cyanobacteria bacterium UBA8530]|nr:N-acetyltransferase [Cyanobacteria bacterium UBA8530]